MSKKVLLATIAILFVMIGAPQSVMALNMKNLFGKNEQLYVNFVTNTKIDSGEIRNVGKLTLNDISNIVQQTHKPNGSYYNDGYSWKVVYPNGNIVSKGAKGEGNNAPYVYIKDKKCFFIIYETKLSKMGVIDFINGKNTQLILTTDYPNSFRMGVFNAKDIPEAELHKIIQESVLPMFLLKDKDVTLDFYYSEDLQTHSTEIGERNFISSIRNGIYKTKSEINKENEKKDLAERQALNKKYGKAFVDAVYSCNLKVGMPLDLLTSRNLQWVQVYKMQLYNGGESGQVKVQFAISKNTGVYYRTYRVWISNRKVTKFRDWTNTDEREFNRL